MPSLVCTTADRVSLPFSSSNKRQTHSRASPPHHHPHENNPQHLCLLLCRFLRCCTPVIHFYVALASHTSLWLRRSHPTDPRKVAPTVQTSLSHEQTIFTQTLMQGCNMVSATFSVRSKHRCYFSVPTVFSPLMCSLLSPLLPIAVSRLYTSVCA